MVDSRNIYHPAAMIFLRKWTLNVPTGEPAARVPKGVRIYAIGDVHGRADLLERLFKKIDRDFAAHPIRRAIQVFLGDYVDCGPGSREVLDELLDRAELAAALAKVMPRRINSLNRTRPKPRLSMWEVLPSCRPNTLQLDPVEGYGNRSLMPKPRSEVK